jgi:hypothetical protein
MQSASNVPVVLEAAGFSHSDVLQYSLVVLLWSGGEVWQVWRCAALLVYSDKWHRGA